MKQQILDGTDRLKRTTSQDDPLFQENFPPDWQSGNFYTGKKTKGNTVVFSSNKRRAFELQFHLIVNLFKNVCERS